MGEQQSEESWRRERERHLLEASARERASFAALAHFDLPLEYDAVGRIDVESITSRRGNHLEFGQKRIVQITYVYVLYKELIQVFHPAIAKN